MLRLFSVLLLICLPAAGQWKPFVDQYGPVPVDLFNPLNDVRLKTEWYQKARPALEKYATLFILELNCRGFVLERVTYDRTKWSGSPWGWGFAGEVRRSGLAVPFLIQESTPLTQDPVQLADILEAFWTRAREQRVQAPWIQAMDEARVLDWKALFLWEPSLPQCKVYFTPGVSCSLDLNSGSYEVKP